MVDSTRAAARVTTRRTSTRGVPSIFVVVVAAVVAVGLATIGYARATLPDVSVSGPQINDHWHAAYGFYLCDEWFMLSGDLEETDAQGVLTDQAYLRTGVHSHDDGVIHWHPFTSRAVGSRATLGVFLENYGVELTDTTLAIPPEQRDDAVFVSGETLCGDEPGELSLLVWDGFTDTGPGVRYIANMTEVPVTNDAMVFSIVFAPRGTDVGMPPWSSELPRLGVVDVSTAGGLVPSDVGDVIADDVEVFDSAG